MLRASSHRGGLMCPRRDSEPRVEKRTRSIVPEFWVLATNPETILLGQCLWTFFLHVRDVLWGKRRVGRKECIITSFFFFLQLLGSVGIHQSHVQTTLEASPVQASTASGESQRTDPTLQSPRSLQIQVSMDKTARWGNLPPPPHSPTSVKG